MIMEHHLLVAYVALGALLVSSSYVPFPKHVLMLGFSFLCIYIGAHKSLEVEEAESMSTKDAYMFPLIGSAVLLSLYLLVKYISQVYVNLLLSVYFFGLGVLAVGATLDPLVSLVIPKSIAKKVILDTKFNIPFYKRKEGPFQLKLTVVELVAVVLGVCAGTWYIVTKHWVANNLLGVSFSIQGVEYLSLGSFKIGCILLSGLFVYDVFWVFGTDVMVTVAKSFDAPIKLLFPRQYGVDPMEFSLLGLGDIVLPGIFIALLLRFDEKRGGHKKGFNKTYFYTQLLAYFCGLGTTILVMLLFDAPQPALLYLVPAAILSALATAAARHELPLLFDYRDEEAVDAKKAAAAAAAATKTE